MLFFYFLIIIIFSSSCAILQPSHPSPSRLVIEYSCNVCTSPKKEFKASSGLPVKISKRDSPNGEYCDGKFYYDLDHLDSIYGTSALAMGIIQETKKASCRITIGERTYPNSPEEIKESAFHTQFLAKSICQKKSTLKEIKRTVFDSMAKYKEYCTAKK